jgi:hypothetical protein
MNVSSLNKKIQIKLWNVNLEKSVDTQNPIQKYSKRTVNVDLMKMGRVIVHPVRILVNYLILDEKKLRKYSDSIIELLERSYNRCHTVNRFNCYSRETLVRKIQNLHVELTMGHLLTDSVPCAESVLKESNHIDLKISRNVISSNYVDFTYLKFLKYSDTSGAYLFVVQGGEDGFDLAYDYLNCKSRKSINVLPDISDNCESFKGPENKSFIAYLESPIYLAVRGKGKSLLILLLLKQLHY